MPRCSGSRLEGKGEGWGRGGGGGESGKGGREVEEGRERGGGGGGGDREFMMWQTVENTLTTKLYTGKVETDFYQDMHNL